MRASARTLLFPRPRRFGKTLALTTLAAYLERTDDTERASRAALFEDLAVWQAGDDMRAHFGRYPVVMLSFKDVKATSWEGCHSAVTKLIGKVAARFRDQLRGHLSAFEQTEFEAIATRTADDATVWDSLALLSE